MNLCSEPECVNSRVKFEDPDRKPHLPTHRMLKTRRFIFDREIARVENAARNDANILHSAILQFREASIPKCTYCKTVVTLPSWFCAECAGEWKSGTKVPL